MSEKRHSPLTIKRRGRTYDFGSTNPQFRGINEAELERLAAKYGELEFDPFDGSIYMYIPGLGYGHERRN